MSLQEIKVAAGIQDNPDQEGLDLFAELLINEILANHCSCYKMGYHTMVDFQQRSAEAIAKQKERTE